MATRTEFKKLSLLRMEEAKVLHTNGLYDGASYLAGYALELALKARICKLLNTEYPHNRSDYGSFLTHKFAVLLRLAGLEKALISRT